MAHAISSTVPEKFSALFRTGNKGSSTLPYEYRIRAGMRSGNRPLVLYHYVEEPLSPARTSCTKQIRHLCLQAGECGGVAGWLRRYSGCLSRTRWTPRSEP
eukprot:scaffold663820_cov51-Prasinocladus_malaysianus.AAC.3